MPTNDESERPPVTTMRSARQRVRTTPAPERDDAPVSGPPDDEPEEAVAEAPKTRTRTRVAAATNGNTKPPADDDDNDLDIRGGWTEAQQIMDSTASFAQVFKPTAELQFIKFLQDSPYANYKRHWLQRPSNSGQVVNRPFLCLDKHEKGCPLCDIGEKQQAVSAFNVVLLGDEDQVLLKTFDVGVRIYNQLKVFNADRRIGPLTKQVYSVQKSGTGNNATTSVVPIIEHRLEEDYGIKPPTPEQLKKAGLYDRSYIQTPTHHELREIALEIAGEE